MTSNADRSSAHDVLDEIARLEIANAVVSGPVRIALKIVVGAQPSLGGEAPQDEAMPSLSLRDGRLHVSGNGTEHGRLHTQTFDLELPKLTELFVGDGAFVTVRGDTEALTLETSFGAFVDAKELNVAMISVDMEGGSAEVRATERITGFAGYGARLDVYGGVETDVTARNAGRVTEHA